MKHFLFFILACIGFSFAHADVIHHRQSFITSTPIASTDANDDKNSVLKCEDIEYHPFLEVGKEWRYLREGDDGNGCVRFYTRVTVEDTQEIDGKLYYHVVETPDDSASAREKFFWDIYMREDVESRQVWWAPDLNISATDSKPIYEELVYDFIQPLNGLASGSLFFFNSEIQEIRYEGLDGWHTAFVPKNDRPTQMLVDGYGFIGYSTSYSDHSSWSPSGEFLFGFEIAPTMPYYEWKLYEIVNGAGETIYSYDANRPKASSGRLSSDNNAINLTIENSQIVVSGNSCIGSIRIISASGAVIAVDEISGNEYTYPISDLQPGVYILITNGCSRKFVVK